MGVLENVLLRITIKRGSLSFAEFSVPPLVVSLRQLKEYSDNGLCFLRFSAATLGLAQRLTALVPRDIFLTASALILFIVFMNLKQLIVFHVKSLPFPSKANKNSGGNFGEKHEPNGNLMQADPLT